MPRKFRLAMLPILACVLTSAAPVLTGCSDGPTSSGACCKICKTGKPCGDTCIDATATCHKGPGCACSG